MIRFGTYSLYKDEVFRLISEKNSITLIYNGDTCPFPNFIKYSEEVYCLSLPQNEITNSFFIKTKCIYKGFEFDVEAVNNDMLRIVTDNEEAFDILSLEFRDRGVYQTEVNKYEIDKLWEIKQQAYNGLPIPEGIKKYEEVDVSRI